MREGFIPAGFKLIVSEAMYYIIDSISETFPVLTSFSVYVWKQMEYIIDSNRYERYSIPEKNKFLFGWGIASFTLKCKNSNKVTCIAIHYSFFVA